MRVLELLICVKKKAGIFFNQGSYIGVITLALQQNLKSNKVKKKKIEIVKFVTFSYHSLLSAIFQSTEGAKYSAITKCQYKMADMRTKKLQRCVRKTRMQNILTRITDICTSNIL